MVKLYDIRTENLIKYKLSALNRIDKIAFYLLSTYLLSPQLTSTVGVAIYSSTFTVNLTVEVSPEAKSPPVPATGSIPEPK